MWYSQVATDLSKLPDAIDWFQRQLETAWVETKIVGSVEKNSQELSGIRSEEVV